MGTTSEQMTSRDKVHFLQLPTHRIVQKQQKVRDPHVHHRRGYWSPLPCPAPPTLPASCPCAGPSTTAAFRACDPPQVELCATDWHDTHDHTKARPCVRQRRRQPLSARSAAPRDSRRWLRARWSIVSSEQRIASRSKLRPVLLANEGAVQGQQGITSREGAQVGEEKHGRVPAHRAEVAHLFRLVGAPI